MRSSTGTVTLGLLALLTSASPAQLTPFLWETRGLIGGAQCSACVIDQSGSLITGFQVPSIAAPVAAKHMLGVVWILNPTSGDLIPHTISGPIVSLPVGGGSGLAVAPNGDLWIQSGGLFTPSVLERRTVVGSLLFSVTPTALAPIDVRVDPAGSVWIVDAITGQVEKLDPAGGVQGTFTLPVVSRPSRLEVGPSGDVWIMALETTSTAGDVVQLDNNGTVRFTTSYPDLRDFDLDVCGRPHVLHMLGGGSMQCVDVLDPANGSVMRSTVVPAGSPDFNEIKLSTSGAFWLTSTAAGVLVPVSRSGTFGAPLPLPGLGGPSAAGDPSGVHLVSVVDPLGDGDADGVPNADEIASGSDPLDPTSLPAPLFLSGTPAPGLSFSLAAVLPGEVGRPYLFAIAGNPGAFPIGGQNCLQLPVAVDPILSWWLGSAGTIASNWFGPVPQSGIVSMSVMLPPGPSLQGNSVTGVLVTADSQTGEIATISQTLLIPLL